MADVKIASRSENGLVRKDNQDCVLCLDELGVFAVADGMGGGSEGALASRIVCDELSAGVKAASFAARLDEISAAVASANARIFAHARELGFRQMGSTVALLAVDGPACRRGAIGYVGDSRVYRVRGKKAELLTRDHSVGAELEASVGTAAGGRFSMRSNPLAHILTRAIGTKEDVLVEWRKIDIADGDRFVICSDGVHDVMDPDAIAKAASRGDVEAAAESIAGSVVKRGAPDNYSFVIVETGGAR